MEFFPGIIGASPNVRDIDLCGRHRLSQQACAAKVDPIYKGLALTELTLAFPFPKNIRLAEGQARICVTPEQRFLLLDLPNDIEAIDPLGNIENFKPDPTPHITCRELAADNRG